MSILKKFRIKNYKTDKKILKIENLKLKINNNIILENLNINLYHGQILGILGPNGAGKSSLFNLIIGLLRPDAGSIILNDEKINNYPIYKRAKQFQIGYVPQYGGYFYDLTVYENLKSVSEITIKNKLDVEKKINYLIYKFELDSIKNLKADNLSGGQKKKLVIAMSLVSSPKILLLDEPFAALDIMTIEMIQKIVIDLQTSEGISIILCDHQARDLLNCVDTAAIISNGTVVAQESPSNLIKDAIAKDVYFGHSFSIS